LIVVVLSLFISSDVDYKSYILANTNIQYINIGKKHVRYNNT